MEEFVAAHRVQLEMSGVPELYWETLFEKIKQETFDAGDWFVMNLVEEGWDDDIDVGGEAEDFSDEEENEDSPPTSVTWHVLVNASAGIDHQDPRHIYLVDHAWTYRLDQARSHLENNEALLRRMAKLMEIDESLEHSAVIDGILGEMWRFNMTYNIATAELGTEAALPVWYIMDEFGSRIQHADSKCTVKMAPFCFLPTKTTYTLMWPTRSIMEGEELTRDYLCERSSACDPLLRKLLLLPWQPDDMRHLSFDLKEDRTVFLSKLAVHESLPNLDVDGLGELPDSVAKLKVYTDVDQVKDSLTDNRFEITNDISSADIVWTQHYLRDFKSFSEETPHKFINQFPYEMVLTVKNLLAVVSRRAVGGGGGCIDHQSLEARPTWIPLTFNLQTELSQFVSYFQHRAAKGLDNYWICKPFNLARGLDAVVTDNINCVIRLSDTGPKVASKYITDPVLIERDDVGLVKFDLRFIVMVISVSPLELCIHQKFVVRLANKKFSLDELDDYEKHFTVMQYKKGLEVKDIDCEDFKTLLNHQYPNYSWDAIQEKINAVIRELFTVAVVASPPAGIGPSPQSRAIYGIDFMLEWRDRDKGEDMTMEPVVLEVNFGPDCTRMLESHPDLFNDVFSTLFFYDVDSRPLTPL